MIVFERRESSDRSDMRRFPEVASISILYSRALQISAESTAPLSHDSETLSFCTSGYHSDSLNSVVCFNPGSSILGYYCYREFGSTLSTWKLVSTVTVIPMAIIPRRQRKMKALSS